MAMPQQDNYIEQIHRHEGLMAYEGERRSWGVEELGVEELGVGSGLTPDFICGPSERAAFVVSRSPVRFDRAGLLAIWA